MRIGSYLLAGLCLAGTVSAEPVTYTEDVAPIFYEKCLSCHRTGEIAPFSMEDFSTIRPWAKSIRKTVASREMPPWHADSEKTEFLHDRSLSQEQIDTIVKWVDQGAKRGDPADLPPLPEFDDYWSMGEPDMIFTVDREFRVPAGDQYIPYQSLYFEPAIEEDLYITEWEIRPTVRGVVHHANLVRAPERLDKVGIGRAVLSGGDYLGSYLPGARPFKYPEDTAYRIPAGDHLQIQVHYAGMDEDVTDRTQFGVRFAQGRIDKIVRSAGTDDWEIEIAPYESDWVLNTEVKLLFPVTIYSSGAHMHLRGSAYTMSAILPDGTEKLIADVPRYDFNWQSNYELANPVSVPAGTRLHVEAHWDNSDANPNNPDPSQRVVYGKWTENEMLTTWAHITLQEEQQGFIMEDGRVVGRAEDGEPFTHPPVLQTLPATFNMPREEPEKETGAD